MNQERIQVDQHGRLLFPSKIRKQYNLKSGDVFIIRKINDNITLISLDKIIKDAQDLFKVANSEKENVVDDFLQERKEQARLEEAKYDLWSKK